MAACACAGGAQPSPVRLTSLEATVLSADAVAEATLTRYTLSEDATTIVDATFAINETLKGDASPRTLSIGIHQGFRSLEAWKEGAAQMLLVRHGASWSVIELSDPKSALLSADFTVLRTPEAVSKAVRAAVRNHPGLATIPTVRIRVPAGVAKSFRQTGMGTFLEVPVDRELERRALSSYRSSHGLSHEEVANVLGYFNSTENIAILKSLLTDPSYARLALPDERIGHEHHVYPVRRAAYASLNSLGVHVSEPVTDEDVFAPESVTYVYLERDPDVSKKLHGLEEFANLGYIDVAQTTTDDADVARIATLPAVKDLTLTLTRITDAGLAEVGKMKQLTRLSLVGTAIDDAGLANLTGLQSLEELDLGNTSVDDRGLVAVAKLSNLRYLSFGNTKVTVRGLAALRGLKHLDELHFSRAAWEMGDQEFVDLAAEGLLHTYPVLYGASGKHTERDDGVVRALFFSEKIGDKGLAAMASLRNLRELMLPGSQISDNGMKIVAGFKRLESLVANNTGITDAGLMNLGALKLRALALGNTQVTDEGLKTVSSFRRLDWLVLNQTKITDDGVAHLCALKALRNLQLVDTSIGDPGVHHLLDLHELESLSISGTQVTDTGLLELARLKTLKSIFVWRADENYGQGPGEIPTVAAGCDDPTLGNAKRGPGFLTRKPSNRQRLSASHVADILCVVRVTHSRRVLRPGWTQQYNLGRSPRVRTTHRA